MACCRFLGTVPGIAMGSRGRLLQRASSARRHGPFPICSRSRASRSGRWRVCAASSSSGSAAGLVARRRTPKPDAPREFRESLERSTTSLPGRISAISCPSRPGGWISWRSCSRLTMAPATIRRTATTGCSPAMKSPQFNAPALGRFAGLPIGSAVARLKVETALEVTSLRCRPESSVRPDNLFHYAAYLGGYANPSHPLTVRPNDPPSGQEPENCGQYLVAPTGRSTPGTRGDGAPARHCDPEVRDLDAYASVRSVLTGAGVAQLLRHRRRSRRSFATGTARRWPSALLARRAIEVGVRSSRSTVYRGDHHGTPPQLQEPTRRCSADPPLDRAIGAHPDGA